jgi:pyruvate,water dikinase
MTSGTEAAPAAAGPLVLWFDDGAGATTEQLGGKCLGLAEMTAAGLEVPPGFAVTTLAHRRCLEPALLRWLEAPHAAGHHVLNDGRPVSSGGGTGPAEPGHHDGPRPSSDDLGPRDLADLPQGEMAVLHDIADHVPLAPDVMEAVEAAYAELGRRSGLVDPPVAVRSSGQIEDGGEASFAGQFDTYLWVVGTNEVLEAVRRVWTGSLASSALAYRIERDLGFGFSPMAIGVQLMVDARSAGVMFTLDPRTGDRSRVVIESSWGLGESVVAGDVQPDRVSVNKVTGVVTVEGVGTKEHERRFDAVTGGVVDVPVDPERRGALSLSDEEVRELVGLGRRLEQLRGGAQDVEWAIDRKGKVSLLQVRPETVWSARQHEAEAPPERSALECVAALFKREIVR